MSADLAHAYAVVIGCEDYPMDRWALNGPVFDALDIAKWLTQAGMPAENLHLLASPLAANQAEFDKALAALGGVVFHGPATSGLVKDVFQHRIMKAISKGGSLKRAGQVLVFWSGHGIVQRHHSGYDRIVFCTDVQPNGMECVSIPAIADWLASQLPEFQLIFLIDACASESSKLGVDSRLSFVGLPWGELKNTPSRFLAYAAYPGQVARNQGGNQRGLFTSAILEGLHNFHPTTLEDFRNIDSVVERARDTVNSAYAGRQSVVWDMVDWKGNREHSSLNARAADKPNQAPPGTVAAFLCDRKHQWAEFLPQAKQHQATRRHRPMLVVTHGERNQDAAAFLSNLSYRIEHSRLWPSSVSTIDHILQLDHWDVLPEEELHEHLVLKLGRLICAEGEPILDIAARINARRSTWVVFIPIASPALRKDPRAALMPLFRFWQAFPDVSDSALVAVVHIVYPPMHSRLLPEFLKRRMHPDRVAREAIAAGSLAGGPDNPVCYVPTELGTVTVDDVATWGAEIQSAHRTWIPPTEREIKDMFKPHQHQAMDEIVRQLLCFIQKGQFRAST